MLVLASWIWLAGALGAAIWAFSVGADRVALGWGAALAIAPALASFVLAGRVERGRGAFGCLLAWLVAATGLTLGCGADTPAVATLVMPAMLALPMDARSRWLALVGAALGLGLAIGLAPFTPAARLSVFPQGLGIAAILTAGFVVALSAPKPDQLGPRLAEAAHELRTPLTHIVGFAEMIERRMLGDTIDDRYVEYGQLIRRSGTQLLVMVNDLLELSSLEAGRYPLTLESFDARDVVADVVRLSLDTAARKGVALAMTTPDAALMVRADRQALQRMLVNTIGNAIKFTPEGGQIFVRASAEPDGLVLETRDSGPGFGIDPAKLGSAYERGAAPGAGTGLGLALVRALARRHNGDVSFGKAPEGGALVRIALPVLSVGL